MICRWNYFMGGAGIYVGTIIMEGAAMSLESKVRWSTIHMIVHTPLESHSLSSVQHPPAVVLGLRVCTPGVLP